MVSESGGGKESMGCVGCRCGCASKKQSQDCLPMVWRRDWSKLGFYDVSVIIKSFRAGI